MDSCHREEENLHVSAVRQAICEPFPQLPGLRSGVGTPAGEPCPACVSVAVSAQDAVSEGAHSLEGRGLGLLRGSPSFSPPPPGSTSPLVPPQPPHPLREALAWPLTLE